MFAAVRGDWNKRGHQLRVGGAGGGEALLGIITNVRVESGDEHEGRLHQLVDSARVSSDAGHAVVREASRRVGEKPRGREQCRNHDGLEHVELEVTCKKKKNRS